MDVRELRDALEQRGLTVIEVRGGQGERLKVVRHRGVPYLDETVTVKDGIPYWSWDTPIEGDTPGNVAERIDNVVSIPAGQFGDSA